MAKTTEPQRATVALARMPERNLQEQALRALIAEALAPFGGLAKHVKQGARVLLKPNQTLGRVALMGSTTSPRLIRALISECFDCGAREVWVAEAAGHAQSTRHVMSQTGLAQAVRGTGAHLIYLEEIAQKVVFFGRDAKGLRYMPVPEIIERADVIINVPKAKTHFVDPISGACKNWVGVMPMAFRLFLQREADPYYRGNALLLRKFRPALNIMDGGYAGEGQGPGGNTPFWWGWLLASDDPVAMDVTVARLFDLPWERLRMAREAAEAGVGVFDPKRIDLVGASFEEARRPVQAADPSVHRYPCRVLVGRGATIEGTLGHWKTMADAWLEYDLWHLFTARGRPTFMFGAVEDPDFEEHLKEGPYVVLDDSALDTYKYDPRVIFVPGSPVPQSYMQNEMLEGMGFGRLYAPGRRAFEGALTWLGEMRGVSGRSAQAKAIGKALGYAAAAVGAPLALGAVARSRRRGGSAEEAG
jgi:uncharacterized protein (DUF362 family)